MKIHNASTLGFATRSAASAEPSQTTNPAAPAFSATDVQWVTLRRADELVQVRAIGARSDGSFLGEVFGLDAETPLESDGIRMGDQIAFQPEHVFAFERTRRTSSAEGREDAAEERLRQADRLKAQFIATLSQQGPSPFAPILSTIHFLQAKAPHDLKFAVDLLERQAGQIKRLVNDLLDLSRIQNGTLQVKRRRVDLAWVLHSAIEDVRPLFDEKRQHFTDRYPQQRIELEADSARLAEAVANLLSNASKYTPVEGHIELSIERHPEELLIKVSDSGVGIPESLRDRIFEPFVQGDAGNERREGLGIGLALVKSIVQLHGGRIELKSEGPGKGSEFVVRLPTGKPAAPQ
ncbi:MAG TPA: HAMP domain-containing sensor histidine kinase [Burkholderiales bacterium]